MGENEENIAIGLFTDGVTICKDGKCIKLTEAFLDTLFNLTDEPVTVETLT
jgi:hypothetical protein